MTNKLTGLLTYRVTQSFWKSVLEPRSALFNFMFLPRVRTHTVLLMFHELEFP